MTPFFSIIIPVYNVAPYLRECLDSVLAQTFTDWEAICVDDGSSDGSGEMLDVYAAKDKRFSVIHQSNSGVSVARNVALDLAKGEWICFLDADDIWSDKTLSTFKGMIECHPAEKLFRVGYIAFSEEKCKLDEPTSYVECYLIDITENITQRDFFDYYFFCYAFKKELLDGIKFPRYRRGEDRCVLNKIQLQRVDVIVASEVRLYGYRQRAGSAMNSIPSAEALLDELDHRLDLIRMVDASGKHYDYSDKAWAAKYFIMRFPTLICLREDRARLKKEWKIRLRRFANARQILSEDRKRLHEYITSPWSWFWDFKLFCLPLMKESSLMVKIRKIYRFLLRHGEFAR